MNTLKTNMLLMHPHVLIKGHERRMTIGAIFVEEQNIVQVGVALCGKKDNFAYKKGRTIALGRANKNSLKNYREVSSFDDARHLFYNKLVKEILKDFEATFNVDKNKKKNRKRKSKITA